MSENDRTRIGDAEREAAIMQLSEAHALGQLNADEFNERTATASAAKTAGDLAPLLSDLPPVQAPTTAEQRSRPAPTPDSAAVQANRGVSGAELRRRADSGDDDAQRRVAMAALGTWVFVAIVTTAVWLATSLNGNDGDANFWPIWPMIGLGIPLVASLARWKFK